MTEEKLAPNAARWLGQWIKSEAPDREVRVRWIGWDSVSYPRYRAEAFEGDESVAFGEAADAWSAIDVLTVQLAARGKMR